jgi:hypothetical protein
MREAVVCRSTHGYSMLRLLLFEERGGTTTTKFGTYSMRVMLVR